jgi:hypothetical protein
MKKHKECLNLHEAEPQQTELDNTNQNKKFRRLDEQSLTVMSEPGSTSSTLWTASVSETSPGFIGLAVPTDVSS